MKFSNELPKWVEIISRFFLCGYILSLMCSMVGMEVFSWSLVLVAIIYGLYKKVKGQKWPIKRLEKDYWFWAFWALMAIGALVNENLSNERQISIIGEGRWIVLLYFLVWILETNSKFIERWIWTTIPLLCLFSLYSITQTFWGLDLWRGTPSYIERLSTSGFTYWRSKGFFMPLTYAYLYGMIFCFLLSTTWTYPFKKNLHHLYVGVSTLLVGLSLITSMTRGLYLALPLTLILMVRLIGQKKTYIKVFILLIFLGIAVAFIPWVQLRITSIWDGNDLGTQNRIAIWKANVDLILENPVLGVGYGVNEEAAQKFYIKPSDTYVLQSHAHNNILQILAGMGITGLICYIGFMVHFMLAAIRLYQESEYPFWKMIGLGSFTAQWIFHLGGLTEATFIDAETAHMFMFVCALTLAGQTIVTSRKHSET